jgi:RNA polymerase sigma factor for flagellar operon FliA
MSEIADLWREYKASGDPLLQEELVVHYQGLVYKLAHKVARKLKQGTEVEELISDGMLGLVKAIDAFEPSRGFQFSTYATPVIRGSIYNGLRRLDWLPERTRAKARNFQKAVDKLSAIQGRKPTEEDIAKELEISAKEVYELIANLSSMYLLSLDQPVGDEDSDASMGDLVEDSRFVSPECEFEYAEERSALRKGLAALDDRERDLLEMHYFQGITFEAISREMGVSKQRVSQLHLRAVRHLREKLGSTEVSIEAMHDYTL